MSARVSELLKPQALGDQRPSQLLTFLKASVARNDVSQSMLRELFISRIPENIRLSLCNMPEASLDQLAMAADKMIDTMTETPREMHDLPGAESSNLSEKVMSSENRIEQLLQIRNNTAGYGPNTCEVPSTSGIPQGRMSNPRQRFPTQPSKHQYNDSQYPVGLCYFHRKFGHQALKCAPPCTWKNTIRNPKNFRWPRPQWVTR